ncbi:ABC transporter permease subunit [Thermopolyspora sp. NPDC052614]|uniref:ABC transporter permease subunit n=1 Tax=Thermopolyspora sp. NPDC052614 TaxID=3155682 RepID=UPI00342AB2DD
MSDVLRSEWTKIRSVRSTMWLLAATLVAMLGLGGLLSAAAVANDGIGLDPANASLAGTSIASILMAVLGVLVISAEYRTGLIRTTLLAVPRRLRMLAGKAIVLTAVVLTVSLVACFGAFFLGQAIFGGEGTTLGEPGVLRAVVGSALYITACALFGLGLGALIRHTAGGVVAVFLFIVVLPGMAQLLPGAWGDQVYRFFTTNAGVQISLTEPLPGQLGPWTGFGVYCAWIAVSLVAAGALLRRRDA